MPPTAPDTAVNTAASAPRESREARQARDLDDYASRYAALPFEAIQVEYRRRAVLEVVRESRARHVVEVGCGLEPLARYATDFQTWTIVEPAAAFAESARKLVAADHRVRVVESTIEGAAAKGLLGANAPDLVLLSSLLHEVPSPEEVLAGVRGVCDANTLVHVNVPNASSLHRELAVAMGLISAVTAPSAQQVALQQSRIFDAESLERLVRDGGFFVVAAGGYLIKPFTHAQMQGLVEGGTIDRLMLDGLFQLGKKFPALASEIFVNARLQ